MILSFDPQELSVLGDDRHLLPPEPAALEIGAMRERFRSPPVWLPEVAVEPRFEERAPVRAAVLIALVPREETTVLLTRRTDHLTDHPGQISFPGGRTESRDADAAATALREAHEEIGLAPSFVDVIGRLPTYTTGTGFVVAPVVASVRPGFALTADPREVAEVFEVPLAFLMNPANHERRAVTAGDRRREFFSMPFDGVDVEGRPRRHFIWGATAAMLRNLYRFLVA